MESLAKRKLVVAISSSIGGGAQKLLIDLAPFLQGSYDLMVICPEGYLSKKLFEEGITPVISEVNIHNINKIRKIIDIWAGDADIIINPFLFGTSFWLSHAFRNRINVKIVALLLNTILRDDMCFLKKLSYKFVIKYISNIASSIIVGSPELNEEVYAYTKKKANYLENRVPNVTVEKERLYLGQGNDELKIGFAARLVKDKQPDIFIRTAKSVIESGVNAHFYIAGEGPLLKNLQEYVQENELVSSVSFVGYIDNIYDFLNEIDVLMCTSLFENTPLIILNCMNMGIPVIGANSPGIPHLIENGIDGFVVNNNLPDEYKDVISLLANDHELYRNIRENSMRKSREVFSYQGFVDKYMSILND